MESTQILFDLIEKCRPWLAIQPRFEAGWSQGCRWVLGVVENWVLTSAHDLLPSPVEGKLLDRCRVRVWAAWSYHWHEATRTAPDHRVDGVTVADMLRRGERPGCVDSPLGGDPLRDSVFVEACLLGQAAVRDQLRATYADVFLREVQRVGAVSEARSLEEEVWDRLDPIDEASRRWLERYCGYSSLRTFLRVTVRHRLLDSLRSRSTRRLAERAFSERRSREELLPITGVELEEFRAQVRRALLGLPETEQILLLLRYREGLPNGAVARRIGLSEGQTSRLHGQAVAKLRDALKPVWSDEIGGSEQGYSLYAQFLLRGLSEVLALQDYTGAAKTTAGPKEGPMSLIRETEKRKDRRTPRKAVAAPARKPAARGEELPPPPPIDLEGLIPDTIAEAVLGKQEPEAAFAELRDTPVEKRPGTLCLDARGGSAEDARTWVAKFDALVYEQDEKPVPNPVEMQVVVFLARKQSLKPFEDLLTRSDIDWILTDDSSSPLTRLYPEVVRKDLTALLSGDPTEGLDTEDDPDARPIEEFLPEDEREEWEQRLKELGHKDG